VNTLGKLFLQGLAIVVPIGLTASLLWWLAIKAERWLGGLMQLILPEGTYLPGMGVVAGIATVILLGILSHVLIFRRLFGLGERLVAQVPLVKTVYAALKDIVSYFSADTRDRFSRVVMVQLPGQPFKLIGFVTRESDWVCNTGIHATARSAGGQIKHRGRLYAHELPDWRIYRLHPA
jgi:uncharacterized membrane protein